MLYVLMVIAAIGMYWANRQYKTKGVSWGRPLAGLFGISALLLAMFKIMFDLSGCAQSGRQEEVLDKELSYANATYQYLGTYLERNHPNQRILLIANPTSPNNKFTEKRLDIIKSGLETGFGGQMSGVQIERLEMPETAMAGAPMMFENLFTAEIFDKIVEKHKGRVDMIISLVGLPMDLRDMSFWNLDKDERPKLVVTNGAIYELKNAIAQGFVTAAVYYNPDLPYNFKDPVPEDVEEAFKKRYVLIDGDNIEEFAAKHPTMFIPDDE